jgi:GDP-L-fucose synthase
MATVLVTGGSGLVGSAINRIKDLYPEYNFYFLSSKECNLINFNETEIFFNKLKPDFVIHLAANVGGLFKNLKYKVDMLEQNILINYNVVKCSANINVKKLICCLSTCIFPDKTNYPINEEMLHNGPPHFSNEAYAYSKRMLEIHCQCYRENYNKNFVCVIPTNIYGKCDNFNLEDGHVLPALIHKCFLAKQKNEDFIVCGSGTPLRQFIYSDDLAKLILWCLKEYNDKSIILSVPEKDEKTIKEVAEIIAKKFDYLHKLKFDTTKSDGQYKKTADNSILMNNLNNFKFTSIDDGISSTIDWFIKNYDHIRK